MIYLKKATKTAQTDEAQITRTVEEMLQKIETQGEFAVREYAKKLDDWTGDFVVTRDELAEKTRDIPRQIWEDLRFTYDQVYGFAEKQRDSMHEFETELHPGVIVGQRLIPCNCAGCYIPGGRYAHAASAIMSIATARAAGVPFVVACSPSFKGQGISPMVLAAMSICNPDIILTLGGVQAIATMAYGVFSGKPANIIVGPGNAYVAEAKRLLFGKVGIDVFAGPSESLVLADKTADPLVVAVDLVSQAEHGTNSPVWLVTNSEPFGRHVIDWIPKVTRTLPDPSVVETSWRDFGEVVVCSDREEMAVVSDQYAPEHLQVQAADLDWWLSRLTNYGALFLGEETTVTYGDKVSGPNHILPTKKAACYSGGLNVGKFIKTVTYQRLTRASNRTIGAVASRISRIEGMEGHARAADVRLRKYFPGDFDFEVFDSTLYQ